MLALGIDPDTFSPGISVVQSGFKDRRYLLESFSPWKAPRTATVDSRLLKWAAEAETTFRDCFARFEPSVIVLERMALRPRDPRPNDILHVAEFGAVALAEAVRRWPHAKVFMPLPVTWRGTIPKSVVHTRLRKKIVMPDVVTSNTIDAAGLAVWGLEQSK